MQFNCGAYPTVQISSSKLPMTFHTYNLEEQFFDAKMAASGKFQSTYSSKELKKNKILSETLQLQFKCGPYQNVQISFQKLPMIPQEHRLVYSQSKQASIINFWH